MDEFSNIKVSTFCLLRNGVLNVKKTPKPSAVCKMLLGFYIKDGRKF